jgi:nitronate monooxygenase
VLTDRISGVPVAVIATDYVRRTGTRASRPMRWMLRHPRLKHWARTWYSVRSVWQLARSNARGHGCLDHWQAGRSVDGIDAVEPVAESRPT